jgi:hypothetical protein
MNLGMFDRFFSNLNVRAQLEEIFDLNKFDRNRERDVIPIHRKNFWTNKWMQEPRKNFYKMQVHHCDPSAQHKKGLGSFKVKRGLTLCYNCRISGHLFKECPRIGPHCLCCNAIGHEFKDFPRITAKVEKMNMIQENYK